MKPPSPSHDEIARRAHEIWTSRGSPSGYDIGHWLEAERELTVAALERRQSENRTPAPGPDERAAQASPQK